MMRPPNFRPPPGACDSHIHVYGDPARFPSLPVHGREIEAHQLDGYVAVRDALGLSRTVVIQTPHYGIDNSSMLDSIATLGQENARGIAVTQPDISEAELEELHAGGVRGLRFGIELARGMRPPHLEEVAARIARKQQPAAKPGQRQLDQLRHSTTQWSVGPGILLTRPRRRR